MTPLKPYLINTLYSWISDNNMTPHVLIDTSVPDTIVPEQFIQHDKIILNIKHTAIANLDVNNDTLSFNTRFSGIDTFISVPMNSIMSIYAKENGQGMMFDTNKPNNDNPDNPTTPDTPPKKKSKLQIIR